MNKYTFRKFLLFSSMVIVVAIFLGGELAEYHKLDTIKDVKVISTSTVMHVEGDAHDTYSRYTYYVNTDKGVFEISPDGLFASKVFGTLKNDSIYTITTRGFNFLERLFPQLKSYRDEEIQEYLITFIENNYGVGHKVDQQSVVSWIKKHGKQKSSEWCEGDEVVIERIIDTILAIKDIKVGKQKTVYHDEILDRLIDWLKNLKNRFNKI